MNTEEQVLLEKRKAAFIDVANIKDPEFIPVMSNIFTAPAGAYGKRVDYLLEHPDEYKAAHVDFFKKSVPDINYSSGLNSPCIKALRALGCESFSYSPDGITIEHLECPTMVDDEYEQLIADPVNYMYNIHAPRKMKKLAGDKETARKAMIDAMYILLEHNDNLADTAQAVESSTLAPIIKGTNLACSFDILFDQYRGFKETMIDVRRRPEKVKAATIAMAPSCQKALKSLKSLFPYCRSVPHAPTFLGAKKFEEFYWPWYKENIQMVFDQGSKTVIVLEGHWSSFFDMLYDMPKGSIMGMTEFDDIVDFKKKYGDKVSFTGGAHIDDLKYKSIEWNIDNTKRIIDECAPNGGFVFTIDKLLMTAKDVNLETYFKINQFVHDYQR